METKKDRIDEMQDRLQRMGNLTMLVKNMTHEEYERVCKEIDEHFAANESRLQIAEGKRDDKRMKKRERRAAQHADMCLIVQDERRGVDRRGR